MIWCSVMEIKTILIKGKQWLLCRPLLSYSCSSPTCRRYPCWDTWSQMPEKWGHCRHSCSKLSATNQPKPSRLLLSSNHLAGSQTYLQTCYCMCREPHTESFELYISIWTGRPCCVLLLGKRGFHVSWLPHAAMQSWTLPCVRLLILLLRRGPHRNMALIYAYGVGGVRRRTTCGGHCCCFFFFLCTSIAMWIEFSCSSEVPQIFCLNSSNRVSVWGHVSWKSN